LVIVKREVGKNGGRRIEGGKEKKAKKEGGTKRGVGGEIRSIEDGSGGG